MVLNKISQQKDIDYISESDAFIELIGMAIPSALNPFNIEEEVLNFLNMIKDPTLVEEIENIKCLLKNNSATEFKNASKDAFFDLPLINLIFKRSPDIAANECNNKNQDNKIFNVTQASLIALALKEKSKELNQLIKKTTASVSKNLLEVPINLVKDVPGVGLSYSVGHALTVVNKLYDGLYNAYNIPKKEFDELEEKYGKYYGKSVVMTDNGIKLAGSLSNKVTSAAISRKNAGAVIASKIPTVKVPTVKVPTINIPITQGGGKIKNRTTRILSRINHTRRLFHRK